MLVTTVFCLTYPQKSWGRAGLLLSPDRVIVPSGTGLPATLAALSPLCYRLFLVCNCLTQASPEAPVVPWGHLAPQ